MNALIVPHQDEVAAIRARVEAKALALQEVWLDGLYPRMMNPEMPDGTYLATGRDLYKYSGQEKKDTQVGQVGPTASITIVLSSQDGGKQVTLTSNPSQVIDAQPVEMRLNPVLDQLSDMPTYLNFPLDDDLAGEDYGSVD